MTTVGPKSVKFQDANAFEKQNAQTLERDLRKNATDARRFAEPELERAYQSQAANLEKDDVVTSAALEALAEAHGWDADRLGQVLEKYNEDRDGLYSEDDFSRIMTDLQAGEDQAMVGELYQELLGREPDGEGLETWTATAERLRAEGKSDDEIRQALTESIQASDEYREKNPDAPGPAGETTAYTIQWGDTLSALAQRFGSSVTELAEMNGIADPDMIIAGATLKVPQAGAPAAPAAPGAPAADPAAPAPAAPATPAAGPAPYINQYQPNGAANGYWNGPSNCGPTSVAMIARAHGYGAGMSDAQLINHLGQIGGTGQAGTGWEGIKAMANAMGLPVEQHRGDAAWLTAQLQAGKMVVANGDYYGLPPHDAGKIGQGGHYVALVGMDANGNILVHDPADAGISPRAYPPEQIVAFLRANQGHGGQAFAIG